MKKGLSLIFGMFLLTSFTSLSAQDLFEKETNVVQATIGFPQLLGFGPAYKTTLPAVGLVYDRGIIDGMIDGNASIGIGGLFGIAGSETRYSQFGGDYGYKYTYLVFGARGTFHYQFLDDLDTYAGVLLGGYAVASSYYGAANPPGFDAADSGGPIAGGFVGARYFFTDNFAAVAEVGYGVAVLNVGIAATF